MIEFKLDGLKAVKFNKSYHAFRAHSFGGAISENPRRSMQLIFRNPPQQYLCARVNEHDRPRASYGSRRAAQADGRWVSHYVVEWLSSILRCEPTACVVQASPGHGRNEQEASDDKAFRPTPAGWPTVTQNEQAAQAAAITE